MLVWLNKDRNRSNSNSSSGSIGKPSSQKIKPNQSSPTPKNNQKLNQSQLIMTKQQKNTLKQTSINLYLKYNLPKSATQQLYKIFSQFDEDEDGVLQLSQFQNLMEKGHHSIKITTARDIICGIKGKNCSGITFQDFIKILHSNNYELDSQEQLGKVFKTYDKNNKGYFNFQDYLTIAKTISQQFSMEEMEDAFNFMDQDKDGHVTFQEFKKSISRTK